MAILVIALCTACGAGGTDAAESDRPSIVVTTNVLGDIARETFGDVAEVEWIMSAGASPHEFDISAAQTRRLYEADLVIANGLGLNPGLVPVLEAAAADGVPVREVGPALPTSEYTAASPTEVGSVDPHLWTDPQRMFPVPELMAHWLIEEVPEVDAAAVQAGAQRYRDALEAADREAEERFAGLPADRRVIVTSHHSFGYFADRYGFEVLGVVLPSGAALASPSAADLAGLTDAMDEAGVRAIFVDASKPQNLAEALAAESAEPVALVEVNAESLTPEGTEASTYLGMIESNARRIADALDG